MEQARVLASVLFTDIVDSTAHAARAGDRRWTALLEAHHSLVRDEILRFGGRALRATGDGFLALFESPAPAIGCASALVEAVHALGLEIRAGIHTGECVVSGSSIEGIAVHIGARVAAEAGANEIVVSGTVRDLLTGSDLGFRDRGLYVLKGLEGEWRLFEVTNAEGLRLELPVPSASRDAKARLNATMRREVSTHPMVGRSAALAGIRTALEEASRGDGRVAILEGEAGIGKSRLLEAALDAAGDLRFQVAIGRAHELERDRPFGPLVDALALSAVSDDPLRAEIGNLLRSGGTEKRAHAAGAEVRFAVIERIVDVVESLAFRRPLVLAIEDLHWADGPTLQTLLRLAARIADLPAVVIATTRPVPRVSELYGLLDALVARGAIRVAVEPLEPEAVDELVRATLGATPGPRLIAKTLGAAGNPLFVSELIAALAHERLIETADGIAEVTETSLPPSLALTVLRRLAFLPQATLEVLRLASALGTAFSLRDLATVMDRPVLDLVPALEEAKAAGLLGESGERLRFRHELVRDAIYEDMLLPIRRAMHGQIGQALENAGAPITQVATHVALGAEPGDAHAVDVLEQAATETSPRAPLVAVDLLGKAIELAGNLAADRNRLELRMAAAYMGADQPREAERIARDVASRTTDDNFRTEAVCALGNAVHHQGRWREAVEILEAWVNDPSMPPGDVPRLVAEAANAMVNYDRERASSEAQRAVSLAEEAGDEAAVNLAFEALGTCRLLEGRIDEGIAFYRRAAAGSASFRVNPRASLQRLIRLGFVYGDRFEEAERMLGLAREASGSGSARMALEYHFDLSHILVWRGLWDEAIAEAEPGAAVSEETGQHWELGLLLQAMIYIAIHRDELDVAAGHLTKLPGAPWTRALLAEARGDRAALKETLERYHEGSIAVQKPWYFPQMWWVGPDWVRLYLEAGDGESARVITDMLEEGARRAGTPSAEGAALRTRGMVERDADLLIASVERYRQGPRAFDRALACECAAEALSERSPSDAVALLEESLTVFGPAGALRDVARVEARLRALGVRRGKRGARRRPKAGWESLTETELRVSSLVQEGLSYREVGQRLFISKRTVETHVAHVFGKLGLSSRRELAEEVRNRTS